MDVIRQTRRDAVYVIFPGVATLGLKEELMRCLIRESYNLILNGRAVPRSGALDLTGIKWGPIKIRPNDLVGPLSGMSYPAGHLFHVELSSANAVQRKNFRWTVANFLPIKGEGRRWLVPKLDCAPRKINRARV